MGNATVIHHLFSHEIFLQNPHQARGIFSMEDHLVRPEEEIVDTGEEPEFRTMHGLGHYHVDFIKVEGLWHIQTLLLTRIKLDFTY